jgi:tRNA G18 (ribose-2'-O)-methylase SpoU
MAIATLQRVDLAALRSAEDQAELERFTRARDRDLRGNDGLFLVESPRVVRRFLRSSWRCRSMLATPEIWETIEPLVAARPEPIAVFLIDFAHLTELSGYRLHGGALALGERTYWPPSTDALLARLPQGAPLTIVVAQGVVQVDNIGAIFRSAACFGAAGILMDDACADPLLRKTIRFSMGRVFDIPWAVSLRLEADLERLRAMGIEPFAIELTPSARPLVELPATGRVALVVGSETYGVAPTILDRCAATFTIPSAGPDEDGENRSLNVAVATAIALHQRSAQRG